SNLPILPFIQPPVGFFLTVDLTFGEILREFLVHRAARREVIVAAIIAAVYRDGPIARGVVERGAGFDQHVFRHFLAGIAFLMGDAFNHIPGARTILPVWPTI